MVVLFITLKLRVLWFKEFLGLAIDQEFSTQLYPLTAYYIWPKTEAWEQLKLELESKPWIDEKDKVTLLNKATEIINYWQEDGRKESIGKVQSKFPDLILHQLFLHLLILTSLPFLRIAIGLE